ncbi:hypothetical protein VP01_627g1 [Puccinia sorghi]|uniref:Uncharacterized protein n=1 Tax=Puccinia sorghi TaxID=27349 RepID=A0A0L6UGF5_9BASI|nr:hypothetical protein VP01_627g1 [Puccinia sorghi]
MQRGVVLYLGKPYEHRANITMLLVLRQTKSPQNNITLVPQDAIRTAIYHFNKPHGCYASIQACQSSLDPYKCRHAYQYCKIKVFGVLVGDRNVYDRQSTCFLDSMTDSFFYNQLDQHQKPKQVVIGCWIHPNIWKESSTRESELCTRYFSFDHRCYETKICLQPALAPSQNLCRRL